MQGLGGVIKSSYAYQNSKSPNLYDWGFFCPCNMAFSESTLAFSMTTYSILVTVNNGR